MPREVSQNVVNALRLLECFDQSEELGITDLAAEIGVSKTVAARLVSSLEEFGYLRQNAATRKYRLGLKLAYLGSLVQDRQEIVHLVDPYLRTLSREFQASAHLAVQDHDGALIIGKVTMGPMVYMDSRVGATLPIHACATGKCLLAFNDERALEDFLARRTLEQYTEQTLTDPEAFLKEIRQVRKQGYAVDNEESNLGLFCVAVPLMDAGGHIVAAMSLSGQTQFMVKNQDAILKRLRETQQALTAQL